MHVEPANQEADDEEHNYYTQAEENSRDVHLQLQLCSPRKPYLITEFPPTSQLGPSLAPRFTGGRIGWLRTFRSQINRAKPSCDQCNSAILFQKQNI